MTFIFGVFFVFGPNYYLRMWLVFIGTSAVTDGGTRAADMSGLILFTLKRPETNALTN